MVTTLRRRRRVRQPLEYSQACEREQLQGGEPCPPSPGRLWRGKPGPGLQKSRSADAEIGYGGTGRVRLQVSRTCRS